MTEVRPQLVICDLDGTLFDTEFAVSQITAELATQAGYPVSAQRVFRTVAGLGSKEKFRAIAAMSGQVLDEGLLASLSEQHRTRKAALYDHPDFKLIDGAGDLIKHLLAHQFTLAAATNNTYEGAAQALKRTGLLEAFDGRLYTPQDVGGASKPNPAMILKILEDTGFARQDSFGLEDSLAGVRAFGAAGVKAFAYLDPRLGPALTRRADEMRAAGQQVEIVPSLERAGFLLSLEKIYARQRAVLSRQPG